MRTLSRVKESFAERFEPDGEGYLFRSRFGSAGYRLSAAERDMLVARFAQRYFWATCGFTAVMALTICGAIFLFLDHSRAFVDTVVFAAVIVAAVPLAAVVFWLWDDPVRHVRGRVADKPALGEADARRQDLARVTWAQLGLVGVGCGVLAWLGVSRETVIYLLVVGVLAVVVLVQMVRKWRASRG